MNRGVFEFSLIQKFKHFFSPDYVMDYLSNMRKFSYYSSVGGNSLLSAFYKYRYLKIGMKCKRPNLGPSLIWLR